MYIYTQGDRGERDRQKEEREKERQRETTPMQTCPTQQGEEGNIFYVVESGEFDVFQVREVRCV